MFYNHTAETSVDAAIGLANMHLFLWVLLTVLISPVLISKATPSGTFALYGAVSFIGFVYFSCVIRDTSFSDEEIEQVDDKGETIKTYRRLNEKEKKELYMPDEFKDRQHDQLIKESEIVNNS